MTEFGENLDLAEGIVSGAHPLGEKGGITSFRFYSTAINKLLTDNYVFGGERHVVLLQIVRSRTQAINYRLTLLQKTTNEEASKMIRQIILDDAKTLVAKLNESMQLTKEIYNSVKSNSLKRDEPSIIISKKQSVDFKTTDQNNGVLDSGHKS